MFRMKICIGATKCQIHPCGVLWKIPMLLYMCSSSYLGFTFLFIEPGSVELKNLSPSHGWAQGVEALVSVKLMGETWWNCKVMEWLCGYGDGFRVSECFFSMAIHEDFPDEVYDTSWCCCFGLSIRGEIPSEEICKWVCLHRFLQPRNQAPGERVKHWKPWKHHPFIIHSIFEVHGWWMGWSHPWPPAASAAPTPLATPGTQPVSWGVQARITHSLGRLTGNYSNLWQFLGNLKLTKIFHAHLF